MLAIVHEEGKNMVSALHALMLWHGALGHGVGVKLPVVWSKK